MFSKCFILILPTISSQKNRKREKVDCCKTKLITYIIQVLWENNFKNVCFSFFIILCNTLYLRISIFMIFSTNCCIHIKTSSVREFYSTFFRLIVHLVIDLVTSPLKMFWFIRRHIVKSRRCHFEPELLLLDYTFFSEAVKYAYLKMLEIKKGE
jgi:hypothetical protein